MNGDDVKVILDRLDGFEKKIDERFQAVFTRLDGIDERLDGIENELDDGLGEVKGLIANLAKTTVKGFRRSGVSIPA